MEIPRISASAYILICLMLFTSDCFAFEVEGVVIHHTASPEWTTAKHIDAWHRERGFDEIGYHYVIRPDGQIEHGRAEDRQGAHALNPRPSRNRTHLGIALVGNERFTEAQYKSLQHLLRRVGRTYGGMVVEPHHEECPGPGFQWAKLTLERQ